MQYKKKSKNPANSGMEVIRNSFGVNIVINLFFKANSLPGFGKIIKKGMGDCTFAYPNFRLSHCHLQG